MAHSLLFTWRRQTRQGRLGGDSVPALVPVEITPVAAPISSDTPQLAPAQRARAETWTRTDMAPLRGWAPRGHRLPAKVPHGRWKT
ncbi:hypothetical protein IVA87_30315, partial [Bradyrhizobium sp. 147]|nr:hypothetical protein [Bradyrhizobium sp. 147]